MNDPVNPETQDQSPLAREERLDAICDQFETQWKAGESPDIEEYLGRVAEGDRNDLLRELIAVELELRHGSGEKVDSQDYHERFPKQASTVEAAVALFNQRRSVRMDNSTVDQPPGHGTDAGASPIKAVNVNLGQAGQTPEKIGRYEIVRELGGGAFGIVYLARDTQLDRHVALKVPRLENFRGQKDVDQFLLEARSAAQMDHPGIVRVYDVQQQAKSIYIVQQYIAGQDLAHYIESQRPAPKRSAELMIGIADAVGFAHQKRFVHRDLKPANILLDEDGQPHVADFGLALHADVQHQHRGELAGTLYYMSPEQIRGESHRLDGRSDIWSLGVIFYKMLTGHYPFNGQNPNQLRDEIENLDTRPPHQLDPTLPAELSRICLICLAKWATERYQATVELIDDLQHWLDEKSHANSGSPEAELPIKVVPQGLRSFDAGDADFFLELLPGPHDREGLPKSIRFWKSKTEQIDPDETFTVGLMYGPSGCGKSSLVKAGLLPRLADNVLPVYVEATAADTEVRLIKSLRKRCGDLPDDVDLPELFAHLRSRGPTRQKVLVVLDQFEQWLHSHTTTRDSQLLLALRQCDGANVQCLCLVRDDFWMSATRFMQELEIPLVEGHNSAAVDLFDPDHARNVLAAFGRAYGKLPELPTEPIDEQQRFLQHAVEGVSQEGRVISIRLVVFAEMMKGRPWTEASLKAVGGTEGVGVTFLEETFSAKTAPPSHRLHAKAIRAVLKALLPEQGSNIKGQMQSSDHLLAVSGYADRPADFDAVLRILDSELRLITPTEPDETDDDSAPASSLAPDSRPSTPDSSFYQLTHDYLVPALRDWLTRKQQETRRGRAELRLAERFALWKAKPENRHLPSLFEWIRIRTLTEKRKWSGTQRKMMAMAGRIHGVRWGTALLLTLITGITIQWLVSAARHRNQAAIAASEAESKRNEIQTAVGAMSTAREILVPHAIDDLTDFPREKVLTELCEQFETADAARKLPLAYALAHFDDVRIDFLIPLVKGASPDEVDNFVVALDKSRTEAVAALETAASTAEHEQNWRHKARLAMLALHMKAPLLAQDMCQLRSDPIQRTWFIEECSTWHGDLSKLAELVADCDDVPLRSATILAVGSEPVGDVLPADIQAWGPLLSKLYTQEPDTPTHSAAGWSLRKWELELPEIAPSNLPADGMNWHVNGVGMTMLKIPAGSFVRKDFGVRDAIDQTVTLTRSFLLGDGEVTRAQFQQFMDDPDCPDTEKRNNWKGADVDHSPTEQHPVQGVMWYDAVWFCNWLSRREGLMPCYERIGEKDKNSQGIPTKYGYDAWRLIPEANGYRLPAEAEWEYACRAGTTTTFSYGDDESLLDRYAVYQPSRMAIPGSKLPNGSGLFDVHGNAREWCQDWHGPFGSETALSDPLGPVQGDTRVLRGGSFNNLARFVQSAHRQVNIPVALAFDIGFRVARTYP